MSLRSWRRRGVTHTAMELGYGSTSAFVFAFRADMGRSPQGYMRRRRAGGRTPGAGLSAIVTPPA